MADVHDRNRELIEAARKRQAAWRADADAVYHDLAGEANRPRYDRATIEARIRDVQVLNAQCPHAILDDARLRSPSHRFRLLALALAMDAESLLAAVDALGAELRAARG